MTVKQGEDINKRFTLLTDSIEKINDNFSKYKLENSQKFEKIYSDYNLEMNNHRITKLESDSIKNLYLLNKKIYINAEEDHRREVRNLFAFTIFAFIIVLFTAAN